jgi:pyruvate dehydrogenase E2 component (dihydrolipoamide acetyltransferase)
MAEIETDKATMEFEAVDEGTIVAIEIAEGTDNVKVGTVIAQLAGEGEDASAPVAAPAAAPAAPLRRLRHLLPRRPPRLLRPRSRPAIASLPRRWPRIAAQKGVDLSGVRVQARTGVSSRPTLKVRSPARRHLLRRRLRLRRPHPPRLGSSAPAALPDFGIPHEDLPLSTMRKTIARRLTESKQQVPHIYLTVDVRLDALLKLRAELNSALTGRGEAVGQRHADQGSGCCPDAGSAVQRGLCR